MSYFEERGLSPEIIKRYHLSVQGDKAYIPYLDSAGEQVAYIIRNLNGKDPKYQYETGKPRCLFNFGLLDGEEHIETLFLAEGEIDTLSLLDAGYPAVGTAAKIFRPEWAYKMLAKQIQQIFICFDGDETGRKGASEAASKIHKAYSAAGNDISIGICLLPKDIDINNLYLEDKGSFKDRFTEYVEAAVSFPDFDVDKPMPSESVDFPGKDLPPVFTFEDMATGKAEIAEENFIISDILPRGGFSLIAGPPGKYKSILAVMIGYHVATGTPLLGEFEIDKPHRVLLIQEEMTPGTMVKRAELMYGGLAGAPACGDRFLIANRSGFHLPEDQGALIELIDIYRIEVCLLDTVLDFTGSLDEDKTSDMQVFFNSLKQISMVTGVAFIGIHHTKKTGWGKKLNLESVRGTMLYGAKADTVMLLDYGTKASCVNLRFPKTRHSRIEDMLLWFDENKLWLEASTSQRKRSIEFKHIDAALGDKREPYPHISLIPDLENMTGMSKRTIEKRLKEALEAGRTLSFPLGGKGNPIGYLTKDKAKNYQGELMKVNVS